tara:strand:- start:4875 stop:5060 length:186 start_codon:yes stop_codon:yes gene_type:complete
MILYICAVTVMINQTDIPWNDHDYATKRRATKTCKVKYKDCLKKFIKKGEKNYYAICGGKK